MLLITYLLFIPSHACKVVSIPFSRSLLHGETQNIAVHSCRIPTSFVVFR